MFQSVAKIVDIIIKNPFFPCPFHLLFVKDNIFDCIFTKKKDMHIPCSEAEFS